MMFEVKGRYKINNGWMPFTKKIEAINERMATEKTYSLIGSNHKIKRNLIKIENIRQVE
ncbi:MAG TPA: 50S ribosomal protein L18a [Archaeoglobaceae archaeon]|nr:50S ribosomal protein L18a [Archaeoglobaceae archaeon]